MFKVNNKDTRTTPLAPCSSVSIVNFEHVIAGWVQESFTNHDMQKMLYRGVLSRPPSSKDFKKKQKPFLADSILRRFRYKTLRHTKCGDS